MTRSPVQCLRIFSLSPAVIAWIWIERQGSIPWISSQFGLPWLDFGTEISHQILWNCGVFSIFLTLELIALRLKQKPGAQAVIQTLTPCLPIFFWFPTTRFLWTVIPGGLPEFALGLSVLFFWGMVLFLALRRRLFSARQAMMIWLAGGILTPFLSLDRALWIAAWVPFFPARISTLRKSVFHLDS